MDSKRVTPLMIAVQGHPKVTKLLLEKGADLNHFCKDDESSPSSSPFLFAASEGCTEIVKMMLDKGADVNFAEPMFGCTGLYGAAGFDHLAVVVLLISRGANCNVKNKNGQTLHFACQEGHTEVAKYLLDHRADINIRCTAYFHTPLLYATRCKDARTLSIDNLLLSRGADPDVPNDLGQTPLHYASEKSFRYHGEESEIVKRLVEAGANVNHLSHDGCSSLSRAARQGHIKAFKILLENGADVNIIDKEGDTPLSGAIREGHLSIAEFHLESGSDIDHLDKEGRSPLYLACVEGHLEAAKLLVNKGANIHQASNIGATPLHIASFHNHSEIVDYLINNGADFKDRGRAASKACKCCGATDLHLKVCKGCKVVWYCSPECQKKDWNEGDDDNRKIQCPRIKEQRERCEDDKDKCGLADAVARVQIDGGGDEVQKQG